MTAPSRTRAHAAPDTKARLLDAAATLFAERGFAATTIREIAERGGVNVAAGHYHFGSKKAVYLEVLRTQFAAIRARLARQGGSAAPAALARMPRTRVAALLQTRVRIMLELLLGPPPGLHGTLMQREMGDPSEALPVIVEEFIRPMMDEMVAIVSRLAPRLDAGAVTGCVHSILGQALFYRFAMPALLRMLGAPAYPRGFAAALAGHITQFSLGGMQRVAARGRGRAR